MSLKNINLAVPFLCLAGAIVCFVLDKNDAAMALLACFTLHLLPSPIPARPSLDRATDTNEDKAGNPQ